MKNKRLRFVTLSIIFLFCYCYAIIEITLKYEPEPIFYFKIKGFAGSSWKDIIPDIEKIELTNLESNEVVWGLEKSGGKEVKLSKLSLENIPSGFYEVTPLKKLEVGKKYRIIVIASGASGHLDFEFNPPIRESGYKNNLKRTK